MSANFLKMGAREGAVPSAMPVAWVSGAPIPLCESPDPNAAELTILQSGSRLEIMGIAGSWYHVRSNGWTGFVRSLMVSGGPSSGGGSILDNLAGLEIPWERTLGVPSRANVSAPVYSAPGDTSVRGANGRAEVGMNSPFWFFGTVYNANDRRYYCLIEYETSGGYRLGYVDFQYIDTNQWDSYGRSDARTTALFKQRAAKTTKSCPVTDDYNDTYVRSELLRLDKGASVTVLCALEVRGMIWVYIEGKSGGRVFRGFVQYDCLELV